MRKIKSYANEKQLLDQVKAGDHHAFTELFNKYVSKLFQVCMKYTSSNSASEEIVQEVFTKIWVSRNQINTDLPFTPYLITIARNLIFNQSKKRLHEITYFRYCKLTQKGSYNDIHSQIYLKELEDILAKRVNSMPKKRKKIFKLSRQEGLRNKEIAMELGISESTVENQINMALKDLKKYLFRN